MKRAGLILVLVMLFHAAAFSQFRNNVNNRPQPRATSSSSDEGFWSKVYIGGGGGFGAGTDVNGFRYVYYSIVPIVGYRVTPQFSIGTGVTYQHYSYPDLDQKLNQYGVSPFVRYNFDKLFFQVEYDAISSPYFNGVETTRKIYNRLLLGIGYSLPLGKRGAINAMVMYDVLYKTNSSPFTSPIVPRVFVTF